MACWFRRRVRKSEKYTPTTTTSDNVHTLIETFGSGELKIKQSIVYTYDSPEGTWGFSKKKLVNRYIELFNPFSRISNSFLRISNSFPQIGQFVPSDFNSFPRIRQSVLSNCNSFPRMRHVENGLSNSRERITNPWERIIYP